jgi:hypothetical protein
VRDEYNLRTSNQATLCRRLCMWALLLLDSLSMSSGPVWDAAALDPYALLFSFYPVILCLFAMCVLIAIIGEMKDNIIIWRYALVRLTIACCAASFRLVS